MVALVGEISFLLTVLSSYSRISLFVVSNISILQSIPQEIAFLFYGIAGSVYGICLWFTIILNIGGGYNEFNKEIEQLTILRRGFPRKNHCIKFKDIQAIRTDV